MKESGLTLKTNREGRPIGLPVFSRAAAKVNSQGRKPLGPGAQAHGKCRVFSEPWKGESNRMPRAVTFAAPRLGVSRRPLQSLATLAIGFRRSAAGDFPFVVM